MFFLIFPQDWMVFTCWDAVIDINATVCTETFLFIDEMWDRNTYTLRSHVAGHLLAIFLHFHSLIYYDFDVHTSFVLSRFNCARVQCAARWIETNSYASYHQGDSHIAVVLSELWRAILTDYYEFNAFTHVDSSMPCWLAKTSSWIVEKRLQ